MLETVAETGKKAEPELAPDIQAVVEQLLKGIMVDRKRATQTIRYLTRRPPEGSGLSAERVAAAVRTTIIRNEQGGLAEPLGFLVAMARKKEERPVASINQPEVKDSWKPLMEPGASMSSLKDLMASVKLPDPPAELKKDAEAAPAEDCKLCGGAMFFLSRRLAFEGNGWQFPEMLACPKCTEELPSERRERLLRLSGLAGLQQEMSLQRLVEVKGLGVALSAVQAFLEGEVDQLVLIGGTGCGKTHLAIGALLACIERGDLCLYIPVARYLDEMRSSYDDSVKGSFNDLMRSACEWDVVVLDDLAGERDTEWSVEKLYEIVDTRSARGLRTIACSNHPLKTWDPRVVSRLADKRRGRVVVLETADYRLAVHA